MNNLCQDLFPLPDGYRGVLVSGSHSPMFVKAPLMLSTKFANFTECAQLADRCNDRELELLRLSCPVTCGCDNPIAGLYPIGAARKQNKGPRVARNMQKTCKDFEKRPCMKKRCKSGMKQLVVLEGSRKLSEFPSNLIEK